MNWSLIGLAMSFAVLCSSIYSHWMWQKLVSKQKEIIDKKSQTIATYEYIVEQKTETIAGYVKVVEELMALVRAKQ